MYHSDLRAYKSRRQNGLKAKYPLSSRALILEVAKDPLQKTRNRNSTVEHEVEKSEALEKLLRRGRIKNSKEKRKGRRAETKISECHS